MPSLIKRWHFLFLPMLCCLFGREDNPEDDIREDDIWEIMSGR